MTDFATGLALILIVLVSLGAGVYEATHLPHGFPGVYQPGPHGTALPGI